MCLTKEQLRVGLWELTLAARTLPGRLVPMKRPGRNHIARARSARSLAQPSQDRSFRNAHSSLKPNMNSEVEELDFEKLKAGDEEELRDFFRILEPKISMWIRARGMPDEDADDILQEAMLKIFQNLDRFSGKPERILAWCYAITRNVTMDRLRLSSAKRNVDHMCEMAPDLDLARSQLSLSGDEALERVEVLRAFRDALSVLSDVDRQLITWRYVENLALSDIAKRLGVPMGSASSKLARVRQRLKDALEAKGLRH
jgi:RNA polymerase sigma-70 factor (ECF subfamily)